MLPLNVARGSFERGSRIQQLLPPIQIHPDPRSLLFFGRCDSRIRHGAASSHGCSPRYILYKLYQVNVHVGRIARRQATMGRFTPKATPSPPPPMASDSEDEDDDDDDDDDDASNDADEDASSTDEMST